MPLSARPGDVFIWKVFRRQHIAGHAAIVWGGDNDLWRIEVLGGTTTATEGEEDSASFSSSQEKDFDQARTLPRRTKIEFALIEMDFLL